MIDHGITALYGPEYEVLTGLVQHVADLEVAARLAPQELADLLLRKACGDAYDPESPHMAETPRRFVQMLQELTNGGQRWKFTTFESDSRELVIERDIMFTSLCAHHVAPFAGVCHIGYIPDGLLPGLSKIARQVQTSSRTLTNQEELTTVIADTLGDEFHPLGIMVIMKAAHSCMTLRGALAHGTETITSATRGIFHENKNGVKEEMLRLLTGNI